MSVSCSGIRILVSEKKPVLECSVLPVVNSLRNTGVSPLQVSRFSSEANPGRLSFRKDFFFKSFNNAACYKSVKMTSP